MTHERRTGGGRSLTRPLYADAQKPPTARLGLARPGLPNGGRGRLLLRVRAHPSRADLLRGGRAARVRPLLAITPAFDYTAEARLAQYPEYSTQTLPLQTVSRSGDTHAQARHAGPARAGR